MGLDTTRLLNNARTHLPGALDSSMQLELFNVLNDLFQNSNIWREEIPFIVRAGVGTYSIEQTSVASITRLLLLKDSAGHEVRATMAVPGELVLNTTPSTADTLTATVSLTVNDPVAKDGFPDFPVWVLNKYGTGILDGLLARMMTQPAKPYTNERMAVYHMRKFNGVVSQAKFETLHGNINNGQTWRFPQTFARRRGR